MKSGADESRKAPDGWTWTIGTVVAPFALAGEMKVRMESDFPDRFQRLTQVCLRLGGRAPYIGTVKRARIHKGQVLLSVEGIDHIEEAETWRGAAVQIPRSEAVPLPEDSYYTGDLIGLEVVTKEGKALGKLERILPYPAQDLFQVGDILVPAVKEFILEVDVPGGRIVVDPPEGLIPEETGEDHRRAGSGDKPEDRAAKGQEP